VGEGAEFGEDVAGFGSDTAAVDPLAKTFGINGDTRRIELFRMDMSANATLGMAVCDPSQQLANKPVCGG
jgi:hypothetical protein